MADLCTDGRFELIKKYKITVLVDADILAKLEAVGNVQGYIKELIRADIKSGQ